MTGDEIIRRNLVVLAAPKTRDVALSESVSGNAGEACYALNMSVTEEGLITYVGNSPNRTNATLRVYVPAFARTVSKLSELVIDLRGELTDGARAVLTKSTWLWNLHRAKTERPLIDRFMKGKVEYAALVEILRTQYPELAKALA